MVQARCGRGRGFHTVCLQSPSRPLHGLLMSTAEPRAQIPRRMVLEAVVGQASGAGARAAAAVRYSGQGA